MPEPTTPPKAVPGDDHMSFWEHLDELRRRLTHALIAYLVGITIVWTYRDPVLAWLWKPFADSWRANKIPGDPALNFSSPGEIFTAYFKLSMMGGLLVSAPVIFYELWSFVAPGLYAKEKKYVIPFVLASTFLFVGGGLFGWWVGFPITFGYYLDLAGMAKSSGLEIRPVVMVPAYLDFVGQMLLAFGIIFELPLVVLALSVTGLVNWLQLWNFGRWFILIAFIVGAIVTPPDATSQLAMSVPLCLLYFLSIGLAYLFGKRPTPEALAADRQRKRDLKDEIRRAREAARETKRRAKAAAAAKRDEAKTGK